MKKIVTYTIGLSFLFFYSCVEEIDLTTAIEAGHEDVLVVEATITDEMKTQVILLSRAYRLEEDGPMPEANAQIRVVGDNGDTFNFQETEMGKYESVSPFSVQNNVNYNLEITTSDNLEFGSSKSKLSGKSNIDNLYFERDFNENEEEGISVYVDGLDPTGKAEFYRYTYEETYKIIAPKYNILDLKYEYIYDVDENIYDNIPRMIIGIDYFLVLKGQQQRVCYNTVTSNNINLTSTVGLNGNDINQYRVHFLNRQNTIITYRYSILVSQYVQSAEAYKYYQTLSDLSVSESLLSQSQPGFVNGNLFSTSGIKVVGFFDVSSVDKKRIYFNYEDLFPGEILPPYFQSCTLIAPPEVTPGGYPLTNNIDQGFKYYRDNLDPVVYDNFGNLEGGYDMVAPICGDCTVMGNNYPPDFWEE